LTKIIAAKICEGKREGGEKKDNSWEVSIGGLERGEEETSPKLERTVVRTEAPLSAKRWGGVVKNRGCAKETGKEQD